MASTMLHEAGHTDTEQLIALLSEMQAEVQEITFDAEDMRDSVSASFAEGVQWFLFKDEQGRVFGCCHLQSVHNYWTVKRRYYLGGFYIMPSHRGQGRFRDLNAQLETWVREHGGRQIYSHIHEDNERSLQAFARAGMKPVEYLLCVKELK